MKRWFALILVSVMILTSCTSAPVSTTEAATTEITQAPATTQEVLPFVDLVKRPSFEPTQFKPKLADDTVQPDLSNIENLSEFFERLERYEVKGLTKREKQMLTEQMFFVRRSRHDQPFMVYDLNDYAGVSSFITSDAVLHMYHVFYDQTLRNIETNHLSDQLKRLTETLIKEQLSIHAGLQSDPVKKQSERVLAYLSVASLCLGVEPVGVPASVLALANQEYGRIEREEGYGESLIVAPGMIDYSQFKVRGHYTVSEVLRRYFHAMMWYGQAPIDLYDGAGKEQYDNAVFSILLNESLVRHEQAARDWKAIYDITALFVGKSVDLNAYDHLTLMKEAFGSTPSPDSLYDEGRSHAYYKALRRLPAPAIANLSKESDLQKNFRLMGQRFTLDIDAFEELIDLRTKPLPTALDLFAVFGSPVALEIRLQDPATKQMPGYTKNMQTLQDNFSSLKDSLPQQNLYSAWLWTLSDLGHIWPEGYPSFMRSKAWAMKELNSGLGSYAELKHDTILYGKPLMAQMGGDVPEPVNGPQYVEPNILLYQKIYHLLDTTAQYLQAYGYADESFMQKMAYFKEFDTLLITCSEKLLRNEMLTDDENRALRQAGGTMEAIMLSFFEEGAAKWSNITNETDRNMALIADIANVREPVSGAMISLKQALGPAYEIYVVVPWQEKLYLARGAVFSYFEFADDKRYTDDEWEQLLKDDDAPAQPDWMKTFLSN